MNFCKPMLFLACLGFVNSSAFAEGNKIKFINKSKWAISQLYLSTASDNQWGPDQLGQEVINTNQSFDLKGIPTGKYDLKLIDEDGDECVVKNIKIAISDSISISDQDLIECQVATEEEASPDTGDED